MNKNFLLKFIQNAFMSKIDNSKTKTRNVRVEKNMLHGSEIRFNLHKQRVDDVAIPKADIVAVSEKISLSELTDIFKKSNLTRLPVFRDTLDNPVGFVHLKDLALRNGFGRQKKFNLTELIRPLIYVPPSMTLGTLLQKMQAERIHMSLVIDEYGGVEGLLTIEDLLEQIVGEINDEHELKESLLWSK